MTTITVIVRRPSVDVTLPTEAGSFEEAPVEVADGPMATVKVSDTDASLQANCSIGDPVDIFENQGSGNVLKFTGLIERRKRTRGVEGKFLELTLRQRGYHALRATPCDPYVYDEDGNPITDRDAVKLNPWDWHIFRSPFGNTLDVDGNPAPLDGVPVEEAFRAIVGWRLLIAHSFQDNRLFRPSDIVGAPGTQIQVVADSYDDEEIFSLQRVRQAAGYVTDANWLRTVPLESGDPNITAMGNIASVNLRFIGKRDSAGSAPVVEATRRARDVAPTYEAVTLVETVNYLGSGLSLWAGTLTFAAAAGNSLGLRMRVAGTSAIETTRIYWMLANATLLSSDTGLDLGTVEVYVDPNGGTLDRLWVDDDYEGLSRAEALERLRTTTITNPLVNPNPNWDIWVNTALSTLAVSFKQRRGATLVTPVFDLDTGTINVLEHEEDGVELVYQVVAEGGGTGDQQFTISDKTEYTAGGLYSVARDPAGGALYKKGPKAKWFRDQGVKSRSELRRRARAFLRDHLDPQPFYRVSVIPFDPYAYVAGDGVPLNDSALGIVATTLRINGLKVSWGGTMGHSLEVSLGRRDRTVEQMLGGAGSKAAFDKKAPILATGKNGVGGPGINFDATHYGRGTFSVPEGVEVSRVLLAMRTAPWQVFARGSASVVPVAPEFRSRTHAFTGVGTSDSTDAFTLTPAMLLSDKESVLLSVTIIANDTGQKDWAYHIDITTNVGTATLLRSFTPSLDNTEQDNREFFFSPLLAGLGGATQINSVTIKVHQNDGTATANATVGWALNGFYRHTHGLAFGIWNFDGDAGTGDGAAKLGKGIKFGVDVSTDANGVPNNFAVQRHPVVFGDADSPVSMLVDVTNYLRKDASGKVASGEHEVFFLADTYTGNSKGLACVQMTAILRAAEATG